MKRLKDLRPRPKDRARTKVRGKGREEERARGYVHMIDTYNYNNECGGVALIGCFTTQKPEQQFNHHHFL